MFTPSPIQDLAIPHLMGEKYDNFFLAAQTGTGKTLAYLLPIFQALKQQEIQMQNERLTRPNRPRAVILVPSKELAMQVENVAKSIAHFCKLKVLGTCNAKQYKDERNILIEGVDILISTPDRLERHRQKGNVYLSLASFFVIDECDTFIDSGFKEVIQENERLTQGTPKSIFVSATYTRSLQNLFGDNYSDQQLKVLVEKSTHMNLHNINHEFVHCNQLDKKDPFLQLLKEVEKEIKTQYQNNGAVLIFCNSIPCCQSLQYTMQQSGYSVVALHGEVPLKLRVQQFNRFKDQQEKFMICTDLGSRGLDFPFLSHVINFDFPKTTSDYLHRAGRTGRAGRKGQVISLYHNKDMLIINELKRSHENNEPLNIQGSQYSKINKEILTSLKQKEIKGEGSYKELKKQLLEQEISQNVKQIGNNKYMLPDPQSMVPEEYRLFRKEWLQSKEARQQLRNYIPERNNLKEELSALQKQQKNIKRKYKHQLGKKQTKVLQRITHLKRKIGHQAYNERLQEDKLRNIVKKKKIIKNKKGIF